MQLVPTTPTAMRAQLALNGDDRFYKKFLYFFELEIPGTATEHGFKSTLIMPLVLAPQSYTIGEPFTVAATPGLGGGLTIEENGILARPISIAGTTGFQPRFLTNAPWASNLVKTDMLDFTMRGEVPLYSSLSGQKQFELLQDRIFRLYGALKKNPATAQGTRLFWHNVKDDEHWQVIPQFFGLTRQVPRSTMYQYNIQLLAVANTRAVDIDLSDDIGLLEAIGDGIRAVRETIDMVEGTIANIGGLIRDIDNMVRNFIDTVTSVTEIFDAAIGVVDAARSFIDGVADFIRLPTTLVLDLVNKVDAFGSGLDAVYRAGATELPASISAELQDIGRGLDRLLAHPEWFETDAQRTLRKFREQQRVLTSDATVTAGSFRQALSAGTAPGPGDQQKQRAERLGGDGPATTSREGAVRRPVGQGQTLEDLAAIYLEDASRWSELAALNGLRSPYIHPLGLPGTLRPGDLILIPNAGAPVRARTLPSVLGTRPGAPETDRLFGVDFGLELVGATGLFDFVLTARDTDFKQVRGIPNLQQAVGTRVRTEQGDSALYRSLGVEQTLGSGSELVDDEVIKLRFGRAVLADPRIIDVGHIRLGPRAADVVDVELDATVYGLSDRVTVLTTS